MESSSTKQRKERYIANLKQFIANANSSITALCAEHGREEKDLACLSG